MKIDKNKLIEILRKSKGIATSIVVIAFILANVLFVYLVFTAKPQDSVIVESQSQLDEIVNIKFDTKIIDRFLVKPDRPAIIGRNPYELR